MASGHYPNMMVNPHPYQQYYALNQNNTNEIVVLQRGAMTPSANAGGVFSSGFAGHIMPKKKIDEKVNDPIHQKNGGGNHSKFNYRSAFQVNPGNLGLGDDI